MPVAVDPSEVFEYILEEDRNEENPTVFLFSAPTSSKKNRMKGRFVSLLSRYGISPGDYSGREDELTKDMPFEMTVEYGLVVLEETLTGWRDFFDQKGRAVPFKMANQRANIDRITPEGQEELAAFAHKISGVTGEETKNSEGLSSSVDSPKTLSAEKSASIGTTARKKTRARPRSGK